MWILVPPALPVYCGSGSAMAFIIIILIHEVCRNASRHDNEEKISFQKSFPTLQKITTIGNFPPATSCLATFLGEQL